MLGTEWNAGADMVLVKVGPREAIYCVQQQQQLYWSSNPLTQLQLGCQEMSLFRQNSDVHMHAEMTILCINFATANKAIRWADKTFWDSQRKAVAWSAIFAGFPPSAVEVQTTGTGQALRSITGAGCSAVEGETQKANLCCWRLWQVEPQD